MESNEIAALIENIKNELKKVIVEQDELIDESIISMISGGHVLLEGVPGVAKTLMVKALSMVLGLNFKRIQFTPDLMPSDITGTKVYNMATHEFELKKGPIFTNFLLADEINRTPPKTQAGLLEAMAEQSVTIDGEIYNLESPYMVFATQNPLEYDGTYPLPEALIDRFLMKIVIDYPTQTAEKEILKRFNEGFDSIDIKKSGIKCVCTSSDVLNLRQAAKNIHIDDALMDYIVQIISETRNDSVIEVGSSPRGSIALMQVSKACALYNKRDYVIPEDIKNMAKYILRHRIILKPEVELEGVKTDKVIEEILAKIKVPR